MAVCDGDEYTWGPMDCIVKTFHHVIAFGITHETAPSQQSLHSLLSRLRMKQLQLLIALDDHQSLHKASSALAMTQSAASKSLAELESMLDAQLFERTKSGLIPNQFGHCVIRYARLMATDLGSLCEEMAQIRSGRGGRLAIGAVMGALPELVVPAVDALQRRHPGFPSISWKRPACSC
jgi:DNA-binding transcriptional LysR family regulator